MRRSAEEKFGKDRRKCEKIVTDGDCCLGLDPYTRDMRKKLRNSEFVKVVPLRVPRSRTSQVKFTLQFPRKDTKWR